MAISRSDLPFMTSSIAADAVRNTRVIQPASATAFWVSTKPVYTCNSEFSLQKGQKKLSHSYRWLRSESRLCPERGTSRPAAPTKRAHRTEPSRVQPRSDRCGPGRPALRLDG